MGLERTNRLGILSPRRHRHELTLGKAQSRQRSAEHTARVDIDGAVQPFGLRHRGVPVDGPSRAPIVSGPVVTDRKPELVRLARRLSVQREFSRRRRGAASHLLLHPRVGDHQTSFVQHEVSHQAVEESLDFLQEFWRLLGQLLQSLGQSVGEAHILAPQLAYQPHIVISWHTERLARAHHVHHEPQHVGSARSAVHQVAQKDGPPVGSRITQQSQQLEQLVKAPVHIADDVERAQLIAPVGPERHAGKRDRIHFLRAGQTEDLPDSLALHPPQASAQQRRVPGYHVAPEAPVRTLCIAFVAKVGRKVKNDRYDHRVVLAGQLYQGGAMLRIHVGRVDHGQSAQGQTLREHEVKRLECWRGERLVVLVVTDQSAEEVGAEHLGRLEEAAGKSRFAAPRWADQQHQAEVGQLDIHRLNTAICVGAPRSGSAGPTGRKHTA